MIDLMKNMRSGVQLVIPDDLRINEVARFLRHTTQLGDCWAWKGHCMKRGWGQFKFRGKVYQAHRFAWALFRGPIADGENIHHVCRNRWCVNPAHLEKAGSAEHGKESAEHRWNGENDVDVNDQGPIPF